MVSADQDREDLTQIGSGLAVKGRGAVHQADVLGELKWIPAFTFPLRLFVEAKFRGAKTGLPVVRNAVGVLMDVNQRNSPVRDGGPPVQKYHYAYAVFSTAGFSKPAEDMALAHQVSLISLAGPEYGELRGTIQDVSEQIDLERANRSKLVYNLRLALRQELEPLTTRLTVPYARAYDPEVAQYLRLTIEPAVRTAKQYGQLFVGMANGPFMLLLKADDPTRFLEYATERPRHRVMITWDRSFEGGWSWTIRPVTNRNVYQLVFTIPEVLYRWIFETGSRTRERALEAKQEYFSNITIYYQEKVGDRLFTLEFDPEATLRDLRHRGPSFAQNTIGDSLP